MKVLVIPDIHGSTYWKNNYLNNISKVDKCVFLGDYFDSFNGSERGKAAADNLRDIISTVDFNKTTLLLGNHDIAYALFAKGDPHVSGHQEGMKQLYNNVLQDNADKFKIGITYDEWTFSHAGFTKTWYSIAEKKIPNGFLFGSPVMLANYLWDNKNVSLLNFSYLGRDPCRDDIVQGPLWVRPASLLVDTYYSKQIVGHTEVGEGTIAKKNPLILNKNESIVIVTDSAEHNSFFILDTEKEYK